MKFNRMKMYDDNRGRPVKKDIQANLGNVPDIKDESYAVGVDEALGTIKKKSKKKK